MELEAFVDNLALQLGEPVLGNRGGGDVEVAAQQLGDAVVQEDLGRGAARLEVGEHELGVLEIPDRLAEGLAALHILDSGVERLLDRSHRADRDHQPLLRQLAHELVEALAFLAAENILAWHEDFVEKQFGGVGGVQAHLVELLAATEAICAIGLEAHQADALGALGRVGLGDDNHEIGQLSRRDEGLRAVQAIAVALSHGSGGNGLEIAPDARLGHGNGADQLARDETRQPALLLLLGPVTHDIGQDDDVVERGGEAVDALGRLLVEHYQIVAEIAAVTAVFLRHGHAEQARGARFLPKRALDHAVLAPFLHPRLGRVLLEKLADRVPEHRDLLVGHEFGIGNVDDGHLLSSLKHAIPPRTRSSQAAGVVFRPEVPAFAGTHTSYFPVQFGLRFSAKASEPSRASALTKTGPIS